MQRYAARAVFRCDAEVIPTAGRTHRFGSGVLEFFEFEDELADTADRFFLPRSRAMGGKNPASTMVAWCGVVWLFGLGLERCSDLVAEMQCNAE